MTSSPAMCSDTYHVDLHNTLLDSCFSTYIYFSDVMFFLFERHITYSIPVNILILLFNVVTLLMVVVDFLQHTISIAT